jgi:hypothetical protein
MSIAIDILYDFMSVSTDIFYKIACPEDHFLFLKFIFGTGRAGPNRTQPPENKRTYRLFLGNFVKIDIFS